MNNRAVFFDLQGTLGGDMFGHVLDFEFFHDAVQAIQIINSLPLKTIIMTNQSRVAKGDLTLAQFNEKMASLIHQLAQQNAQIDAVYCCPHQKADQCECKKPKIGMALQARDEHQLDLTSSYVVGDTGKSDMAVAHKIGAYPILVLTGAGHASLYESRSTWSAVEPAFVAKNALAASEWIRERESSYR